MGTRRIIAGDVMYIRRRRGKKACGQSGIPEFVDQTAARNLFFFVVVVVGMGPLSFRAIFPLLDGLWFYLQPICIVKVNVYVFSMGMYLPTPPPSPSPPSQ